MFRDFVVNRYCFSWNWYFSGYCVLLFTLVLDTITTFTKARETSRMYLVVNVV